MIPYQAVPRPPPLNGPPQVHTQSSSQQLPYMAPLVPTGFIHGDHGLIPVYDPGALSQYMAQHVRTPPGVPPQGHHAREPGNAMPHVTHQHSAASPLQQSPISPVDLAGIRNLTINPYQVHPLAFQNGSSSWQSANRFLQPISSSAQAMSILKPPTGPTYGHGPSHLPYNPVTSHQESRLTSSSTTQHNVRERQGKEEKARVRLHLSEGGDTVIESGPTPEITFPSIRDPRPVVEDVPLQYSYQVDEWCKSSKEHDDSP